MRKPSTITPKPTISYGRLVGRIVEHLRTQQGLHQTAIAKSLGISQSAYSRLELGQSGMSVTQLRTIAEKLRTTPDSLLHYATLYANQLRAQGVTVTDDKVESAASVLIALGILAALIAAASS